MRRALDLIYASALVASALGFVSIASLVFFQIAGRILDRVILAAGGAALGLQVPSLAEIGGFLFVGAAFLALPATLRAAGHVRVTILAKVLPAAASRALTVLVLAAALGLASSRPGTRGSRRSTAGSSTRSPSGWCASRSGCRRGR
jgi:TRAP-type C4-dicarboxylate transport system permease small subunit